MADELVSLQATGPWNIVNSKGVKWAIVSFELLRTPGPHDVNPILLHKRAQHNSGPNRLTVHSQLIENSRQSVE